MPVRCVLWYVVLDVPCVVDCLQEFHPYVFQILAQLIELSSPPLNAVSLQCQVLCTSINRGMKAVRVGILDDTVYI